jgi:hypothetical protein
MPILKQITHQAIRLIWPSRRLCTPKYCRGVKGCRTRRLKRRCNKMQHSGPPPPNIVYFRCARGWGGPRLCLDTPYYDLSRNVTRPSLGHRSG